MFKYIPLTIEYIKRNFESFMEYRLNFIFEIIGMIINNFGFAAIWVIFFKKFNIINGWGVHDIFLLNAIAGLYYGIGTLVAGGMEKISQKIVNGELDFFLTLPKDVLWHILVSFMRPSVLGESLFGIIMFILSGYFSFTRLIILLIVSTISASIFINAGIIYHSLSLYFGNAKDFAERIMWTIVGFTLYPQTIFSGNVKLILYTLIPAGFIATMPVEIIKSFDIKKLLILIIVAAIFTIIARIIFTKGLKKYESGNLINAQI